MSETPAYKTIGVIVGRDLVGDALMKLPFLRALRAAWPEASLHWITAQNTTAYNNVLRNVTRGLIDVIHETPSWLPTGERPEVVGEAPRFDVLLDTRGDAREALRARGSVPHGLFLAPALRYLFSDRRPPLFQPKPSHLCDRLLQLVALANNGVVPTTTGRLPVSPDLLEKARQILPAGPVYVGFAPGAGNRVKVWPRYKFEKVAAAQAAKGRVPVFLLGPQELDWLESIVESVPTAKFPLQAYDVWGHAAVTVEQTLALGSLLDVAVTNDSGTGHMLGAVDCPLVSLFGPTSPAKAAPKVSRARILCAQDYGSSAMNAIRWEDVDRAVESLLEEGAKENP